MMPVRRDSSSVHVFAGFLFFCFLFLGVPATGRETPPKHVADLPEKLTNGWAFEPLTHPRAPVVRVKRHKVRNPIDAFILERLEANHLAPASSASPVALLRRTYFDLTGLPPSPAEIEAFLRDRSPRAYSKVVEGLLNSPQYGERWGRHWLDLARYADTGGFEKDLLFKNAWQYRDYVIRSFNANKRMDRFIQEQVAGDELWPGEADALAATGLYAVGPVSPDSALTSTQLEYEWLTDAVDTTGAAFLGLTLGCARCHDHKYDPISQRDYFAMQAIFAGSDRPYPEAIRENRIKGLNGILADIPIPKEVGNDPRCLIRTDDQEGLHLFHLDSPMKIRRLQRGELSKPRELVTPALPAVFVGNRIDFDPERSSPNQRRAVLANWLISQGNPLTARVFVNRVWGWHFGQGIVRTPNDFGVQGEAPTHPELLDWLARDFVEHGWDLKYLHRLIVSSATYQMQSKPPSAHTAEADPENRFLSHFPRQRLSAEEIWDSMHACAGTINLRAFGPPVVPALSKDELSGLFGDDKWKETKDSREFTRRGIYLFERRTFLFPLIDAFDPPDVMASCPRRFETTVPTQALALLNSGVAVEQARAFAQRLLRECAGNSARIPAHAWFLAFNRPITRVEADRVWSFLRASEAVREGVLCDTSKSGPSKEALEQLCLALFNANEFVFVD